MSAYWLLVPIFLPVVWGTLLGIFPIANRRRREVYVFTGTLLTSVVIWLLLFYGETNPITILNLAGTLAVKFRVDGCAKVFAGLISVLWPLASLYGFEYMEHEGHENAFFCLYTATYGVTAGICFAGNLMTMYLFYEMLTLITIPLVMFSLDHKSVVAARKYMKYSIGGAAFAFIGFISIYTFGDTLDFVYGGVINSANQDAHRTFLLFVYVMAVFGFGVKAAIFPLHGWLPSASVAPTTVTALLHAVAVVKAGAFAIIRITYYSFGTDFLRGTWAQYTVIAFAAITIVYGSSKAVKEQHCKRRLAYSTVSNLSYIIFAAALMTPAGLTAAFTHMVFHGLMKITLFYCIGAVMVKTGRKYLWEMDGIGRKMPLIFVVYTIAGLALIGIPPLCGFISKWYIATAAVAEGSAWAKVGLAAVMISALLTAAYILELVIRAWMPVKENAPQDFSNAEPVGLRMSIPLVILTVMIVAFGLCSGPLTEFFASISAV